MKTLLLILLFPVLAHGFVIDFTTMPRQDQFQRGVGFAGPHPSFLILPKNHTEFILYDGKGICPYDVDSYCGNGFMEISFAHPVNNLSFVAYGLENDDYIWMGLWGGEDYLGFVSADDSCPFADCDPYEQLVHVPGTDITRMWMEFGDRSGGVIINYISGTIPLPASGWFFMSALLLSATARYRQHSRHSHR